MKRYALWALVASVVVGAGVGCFTILGSGPDDPPAKVLFSALSIAHASLLAMACGVELRRGRTSAIAQAGVVLSLVTAPALLAATWGEITSHDFWRGFFTLELLVVAIAYASLLRRATLRPGRRWLVPATAVAVAGFVVAMLLGPVWEVIPDRDAARPLGVLVVLTAAGTLLVWGFHLSDRSYVLAPGLPSGAAEFRHCVVCGSSAITTSLSAVHCRDCHAAFRVELQPALSG